jgi:mRNA interferase RelE/StbE
MDRQLFRIRLVNWRIIYAVTESENAVDVLAVRKRPPYDYGDLGQLLEEIE